MSYVLALQNSLWTSPIQRTSVLTLSIGAARGGCSSGNLDPGPSRVTRRPNAYHGSRATPPLPARSSASTSGWIAASAADPASRQGD
jgi:hypothetical protein